MKLCYYYSDFCIKDQPRQKEQIMQNNSRLIALICAGVSFVLAILCFLFVDPRFSLIFFVLYGIFMGLLLFFGIRSKSDDATDRITEIRNNWREESESLRTRIEENEATIAALKEQESALRTANNELGEEIKRLNTEMTKHKDGMIHSDELKYISILPKLPKESGDTPNVNVLSVAKSVAGELSKDAAKVGLTISFSSTEKIVPVKADRELIRILFRNIIDNSIKYMNRSGSLIITISTIGDDVFIIFKDTGEGLTDSETKHIFELNYQGSNRISGNGLGLYQARAIVGYYGGTIYAKSRSGSGMGIYIQLPLGKDSAE